MALPGRDKTFALEDCRALLDKLKREIERFRQDQRDPTRIDHAFNAAVTAWHLCDWVFADMTAEQRAKLNIATLPDLKTHALQCRALHLCRQTATASKHWAVNQFPDPTVATITTANAVGGTGAPNQPPLYLGPSWYLYFRDGPKTLEAGEVFDEALEFWTQFIYGNGIAASPTLGQ